MNKQQIAELHAEIILLKAGNVAVNESSIAYAANKLTSYMSEEGTLLLDRDVAARTVMNSPLIKEAQQEAHQQEAGVKDGRITDMSQQEKVALLRELGNEGYAERYSAELREARANA